MRLVRVIKSQAKISKDESMDSISSSLAAHRQIPGFVASYVTNEGSRTNDKPDTIVLITKPSSDATEELPKGMRYAWMSETTLDALQAQ